MTYEDLYEKAEWELDHNKITLGEYNEMIKPLQEEIQPKGRWMDVRIGRYVLLHRCSNCLKDSVMESKYCPSCGAKMEAEDETRN